MCDRGSATGGRRSEGENQSGVSDGQSQYHGNLQSPPPALCITGEAHPPGEFAHTHGK